MTPKLIAFCCGLFIALGLTAQTSASGSREGYTSGSPGEYTLGMRKGDGPGAWKGDGSGIREGGTSSIEKGDDPGIGKGDGSGTEKKNTSGIGKKDGSGIGKGDDPGIEKGNGSGTENKNTSGIGKKDGSGIGKGNGPGIRNGDISSIGGRDTSDILEKYIRNGLDSNLALRQRGFDLQKALLDLKRAQSLFYPQAGFSSQYTLAHGGRNQDIPVGDLLNGVYSTLNQLTASNKFPQVANQSIQFLPNDYHDTKMEITLPLINIDLQHNRQVSGEMINARRADLDVYRRELVQQIRQAYYQYLQAGKAVEIYTNALSLVKENRRVSEKFVENRMATKEIVLRAQAQVSQVESSLIEARNKLRNTVAFFNFLLNRPLDTAVQTDESLFSLQTDTTGVVVSRISPEVPTGREELAKLGSMQKILASNLRYSRNYLVPKLSAFYDVGFQGFGFRFNSAQFYQLAGVQLVWPLFKANDNKYRVRQSEIDVTAVGDQYRELTQQLTLQVQTSANDYYSAVEALRSLTDEVASTRETYRLAERRFREGNAIQIELIDARTQVTSAELRYSLGCLTVLDRAADLERVTASYKFSN